MQWCNSLELDTIDWVVNTFDDQWSDSGITHVWKVDFESPLHEANITKAMNGAAFHIPSTVREIHKYMSLPGTGPVRKKIQGISQTTVQAIESILQWKPDSVVYRAFPKAILDCTCPSRVLFNEGCKCAYSKRTK